MIAVKPKQRVPLSEKLDKDFYVNVMHYYIGLSNSNNNKTATLDNMNAANGVVPETVYGDVMKPLTGGDGTKNNLPGTIRDVDFITPIREKNIGEYIQLPREFTVKVDDPNITLRKNKEVADQLKPVLEQALINKINETQDTGVPTQEVPDFEKLFEEVSKDWIDDRAINAVNLVKSILNDNDMDSQILALYNDWWSTEEVYIRVYSKGGGLFFDEISPLEGYTLGNGYEFVDDHEGFVIKRKITMDVINDEYGDQLTDKDRDYLENVMANFADSYYSIPVDVYKDYHGHKLMDYVGSTTDGGDIVFSFGRYVNEYILYYKTEVERKILFYINPLGELNQRVIEEDEDFKFDKNLGHVEVKKEWIQEVWEQVLLGNEYVGVYLKPKPVEVQIYDEKGHCKLPIVGKKGILNGLYINPIPKRIIPNLALYRVITLNIERQFAKYKGTVEIIPQSMLAADGAQSAAGNMFYRNADNTIIYNDAKVDLQTVVQGYRLIGNDAQTNFIKALIEFRDIVKAEAWDMANMNDSRYGQAPASSTVTNNQQNIFNAKLGSVLGITMFNNVLLRLYYILLAYAEHLYPDGTSGSVFNDDGNITYFNIDSGELTSNKYGFYMTNSVIEFQKLQQYKDLAFSAGQHGEFGLATKAIDGNSSVQIKQHIDEYVEMTEKFERQMKEQELAQQQSINDAQLADKQADRDADYNKMVKEQDMITDRELKLKSLDNKNNNNK